MPSDRQQQLQELWKSHEEVPMQLGTEAICAKAHRQERESVWMFWIALVFTVFMTVLTLYRLYGVLLRNYWLAGTMGWLVLTLLWFGGRFLRSGPRRLISGEPCAQFLKREFQGKQEVARAIRLWVLSLVPAVLSAWWGGGPALMAKNLGIHAVWFAQPHAAAPLILTLLALAFIWYAMGDLQRKAEQELKLLNNQA